jgi:hypothetical protein
MRCRPLYWSGIAALPYGINLVRPHHRPALFDGLLAIFRLALSV